MAPRHLPARARGGRRVLGARSPVCLLRHDCFVSLIEPALVPRSRSPLPGPRALAPICLSSPRSVRLARIIAAAYCGRRGSRVRGAGSAVVGFVNTGEASPKSQAEVHLLNEEGEGASHSPQSRRVTSVESVFWSPLPSRQILSYPNSLVYVESAETIGSRLLRKPQA